MTSDDTSGSDAIPSDSEVILSVTDLRAGFATDHGILEAVAGVNFTLRRGETLGIVGESGCGKSVTSLSIMRLLPKPAGQILGGQIVFEGVDLLNVPSEVLHTIRGRRIAMIFQEPMTALNPVHTVGKQIAEVFQLHRPEMSQTDIQNQSVEMLNKVGISLPETRLRAFPHQLSGGMRQRVMIAMALACEPDILIADEPTTALDVTIQAQILDLIDQLKKQNNMAVILITHDLGVVAGHCDRVLVMYAGRTVEEAEVEDLFEHPSHPYSRGLLSSIPRWDSEHKSTLSTIPGSVPNLNEFPPGCRFQNRCSLADERCRNEAPERQLATGRGSEHFVRCFRWKECE